MRVIGRRATATTRCRAGLDSDGALRRRYDVALRRQGVQRGVHQRRRAAHDAHATRRLFERTNQKYRFGVVPEGTRRPCYRVDPKTVYEGGFGPTGGKGVNARFT